MTEKPIEPQAIYWAGRTYNLHVPFQDHGDGSSVGPLYSRQGVDPSDWLFKPDIAFEYGTTKEPSTMHVIQACASPTTSRPTG